jgi:hypothetical protein
MPAPLVFAVSRELEVNPDRRTEVDEPVQVRAVYEGFRGRDRVAAEGARCPPKKTYALATLTLAPSA